MALHLKDFTHKFGLDYSNLIIEGFLRNFFEEIISLCPNRKSGSEKLENKHEKTPLCT
jgi:hypothetical protein